MFFPRDFAILIDKFIEQLATALEEVTGRFASNIQAVVEMVLNVAQNSW